jgi:hypothetical protein
MTRWARLTTSPSGDRSQVNLPIKPVTVGCCSFFVTFFISWLDSRPFRFNMLAGVSFPPFFAHRTRAGTCEGAQRAGSGLGSISPQVTGYNPATGANDNGRRPTSSTTARPPSKRRFVSGDSALPPEQDWKIKTESIEILRDAGATIFCRFVIDRADPSTSLGAGVAAVPAHEKRSPLSCAQRARNEPTKKS